MKPRNKFYQSLREKIGTRQEVSKLLGVHIRTLERREDGQIKITDEMVAALEWWVNYKKFFGNPTLVLPLKTWSKNEGLVMDVNTIPSEITLATLKKFFGESNS